MRKLMLVALSAVVAALALAACGGDDNGEDEDQITEAIEFTATSGDPKACTEAQTQKFTEQTSGAPGVTAEEAVKRCEKDAPDTVADEVDVTNIEIDGDSATAEAAITGAFFDGQTLELGLVKEGDQWKLDEATGFAEFDRAAFLSAFKEELGSDPEATQGAIDCVVGNLEEISDQEVQDIFLLGNADPKVEQQVFDPCFKGE